MQPPVTFREDILAPESEFDSKPLTERLSLGVAARLSRYLQVLTQAKRFETLGAGSAKTLDSPPMVEIAPRPLTKVVSIASNDEPPQIAAE